MPARQGQSKNDANVLEARRPLQIWQAYSVMNHATVKMQVDQEYRAYIQEALAAGETDLIARIVFQKDISSRMYEESNEETKEMVKRRVKDDTVKMPAELVEAEETLGTEQAKRYYDNYRRQR